MTMRVSPAKSANENADPFVVTPPRKHNPNKNIHATTPVTRKDKSTPLHKRFLEEVKMSPGTPTTPPRTPSRSPNRGPPVHQKLEVGQNGFYFSMEIPEKKATPRRAATPDAAAPGRWTPSPDKGKKSRMNVGGSVKDILRKNLFGTPTKQAASPAKGGRGEGDGEVKGSPVKERLVSGLKIRTSGIPGGEHDERAEPRPSVLPKDTSDDAVEEAATERSAMQGLRTPSQLSAPPPHFRMPPASQVLAITSRPDHTPKTQISTPTTTSMTPVAPLLDPRKTDAKSTPSNIGHLMAGLSNKSLKVQTLPPPGGAESMPTPLRKMSERLGLRSPHVVRRGLAHEDGRSDHAAVSKSEHLNYPISALGTRDAVAVDDHSIKSSPSGETNTPKPILSMREQNAMPSENSLAQLHGFSGALGSPIDHSRPSTATTASFGFPSTPVRPNPPSRSKSFGTPAKLRSSMQEDMFKVQESLKRSLGTGFTVRTSNTRPATPMSTTTGTTRSNASETKNTRLVPTKVARPVSMIGSVKANGIKDAQAVPRRPLNTAARKPRPKSMIVGSARILETIASQIDSPRERAKLRSSAAMPSTSRPETAASVSRRLVAAPATLPPTKPQPTVRTTKSAALRAAAHPKRTAASAPAAYPRFQGQRVVSAEAIASRVAAWKTEDRASATPKIPTRTKSTKTLNGSPSKPSTSGTTKTLYPNPKDPKADSGNGTSHTPPGTPPTSPPPKTRLTAPTTPASKQTAPASHAAKLRTPHPAKTPAKTPINRRIDLKDPNAVRTPSKEIQSALDRAIDRKIAEDGRVGRVWLEGRGVE